MSHSIFVICSNKILSCFRLSKDCRNREVAPTKVLRDFIFSTFCVHYTVSHTVLYTFLVDLWVTQPPLVELLQSIYLNTIIACDISPFE